MRTDKQVYLIFEAQPQWLFELTGLRSPGPCRFQSVTLKAIERHSDGVLVPEANLEPLSVVELQMQFEGSVYNRLVIEMALIQEEYQQRDVQGIIIFLSAELDPLTSPWNKIVHVFYLTEILAELSVKSPDHPLVAMFQPVIEENLEILEKRAAEYYNQIKRFELPEPSKAKLLDVFVNWLEQRFSERGKKEIETMLLGELPDLRETQSGKDLIAIGLQEGLQEGLKKGEQKGVQKGEREGLVWLLEAKFGTLEIAIRNRIEMVDSTDRLKELYRQVLNADSIDQMKW